MHRLLAVACILFLALAGCKKAESPPVEHSTEPSLLIGLIPEQQMFDQLERYTPLAEYLSKKTGREINLKILSRYGNIIDNFVSGGLDGAFFGSFTYALAHAKLGIEVLARPENLQGSSTYHGLMFVRKDSGIRTIADMRGKSFAFVDKATTAGYLLALQYFNAHGIKDYKSYLRETYFTGTHEDSIYDVLDKKADIGVAKNTVFERLAKANERITQELVVIEKSPDVPENALAVRKDLDPATRKKLKGALLAMQGDPEGQDILKKFGARRFIETANSDYEPVIMYAEIIGLDLETYDYIND
jgi:phosphonate transport system substrate-binding protein